MTKDTLNKRIAALKDRCKESMGAQFDSACSLPASVQGSSHPIKPDQIVSISALVVYVAHMTGQSEFRVERELSNHFCVPNPKCLPQDKYDAAIRYMVDQVPSSRC